MLCELKGSVEVVEEGKEALLGCEEVVVWRKVVGFVAEVHFLEIVVSLG